MNSKPRLKKLRVMWKCSGLYKDVLIVGYGKTLGSAYEAFSNKLYLIKEDDAFDQWVKTQGRKPRPVIPVHEKERLMLEEHARRAVFLQERAKLFHSETIQ